MKLLTVEKLHGANATISIQDPRTKWTSWTPVGESYTLVFKLLEAEMVLEITEEVK